MGGDVKQEETLSGLAQATAKAEAVRLSLPCRARIIRLRHD